MKKNILLGMVTIIVFSSCKTDYTCIYEEDENVFFSVDCDKCSEDDVENIESVPFIVNDKDYRYKCTEK